MPSRKKKKLKLKKIKRRQKNNMHLKRKTIPKLWPVQRTGSKYLAVPSHNQSSSISLIVLMRDVMEIVKTKKEMKKLLNEKKINVNGKPVREPGYSISLFDTLSLPSIGKHYRAVLKNKRMSLEEIKSGESAQRIYKIIGKKILPGKKVQINFSDGKNLLSPEKIKAGDFALVDNSKNKIVKIIPLEKDTKVIAIAGKHIGKSGKIREIVTEGENTIAKIKTDTEEISANVNNLFVVE